MKRLISVALVLVMVLAVCTACTKLEAPVAGTAYSDGTGTNTITFGEYNADENVGTYTITSSLSDMEVKGTYTVMENDPEIPSYILTLKVDGAAEEDPGVEYVFDKTMDVIQNTVDGIAYFGPNYVEQ
ncbi:MAG: hypothetical protein IJ424_08380 [Oscillospiraceae bacterium]|nr:hypothetical protein [Oscillospiraceae bacterium]